MKWAASAMGAAVILAVQNANALTLSGGIDGRYTHQSTPNRDDARIQGVFLNLRQVWSDDEGDRWIAVAQADANDDFETLRPYQVYLQYKGPMGRWNARGGHFLLPFGLLATHDTERLLLQGIEEQSIGIRSDTGAEVFGHFGAFDYALAVTEGVGNRRLNDVDNDKATVGRLAYQGERWQIGLSGLIGSVLPDSECYDRSETVYEKRIGLDVTRSFGPLTSRGEIVVGTDDGDSVGGAVLLADYALTDTVELNTRFATWNSGDSNHSVGLGLSYQLRPGIFFRVADENAFGEENENAITAQIYMEFSHRL